MLIDNQNEATIFNSRSFILITNGICCYSRTSFFGYDCLVREPLAAGVNITCVSYQNILNILCPLFVSESFIIKFRCFYK